jgi:hypothetical protein
MMAESKAAKPTGPCSEEIVYPVDKTPDFSVEESKEESA